MTLDELLPKVYDDVRPELLPIARYSLEAHLDQAEREGRAVREAGGGGRRAMAREVPARRAVRLR